MWRSEPEIIKALDALDDFSSMLSQGYAHNKARMDDNLMTLMRLSGTVSLRVRSNLRAQASTSRDATHATTEPTGESE